MTGNRFVPLPVQVTTSGTNLSAEQLAQLFHETYERLAPDFGYETRPGTAKPWSEIPEDNNNKRLMIAVAGEILQRLGLIY